MENVKTTKGCTCQKCKKVLEDGEKFCSSCGTSAELQEDNSICKKCGVELNENVNFCHKCGTSKKFKTNKILEISQYDIENEITEEDINENRVMSVFCYFGIFLLIPLLIKPQSKYLKFHSNQGIILMLSWIVLTIILIIPVLGWIVGLIGYIFIGICGIIGIINALSGKVKRLPLIGKYVIIK